MEEKQPGQQPEADRASGDSQGVTARPGGKADGGLTPTERDLELVKQADEASAELDETMKRDGFGDHKGVDGFPALDR
ncbi:MAG: hypothetical protein ABW173_08930 [Sphingomonas sp.]